MSETEQMNSLTELGLWAEIYPTQKFIQDRGYDFSLIARGSSLPVYSI
jgi:hypothetical protein